MLTGLIIALLVGGAIVAGVIVASVIRESVIKKFNKKAFRILIKRKKKKAVNVGIFDEYGRTIDNNFEIKSDEGVSDEIYEGQEIYV